MPEEGVWTGAENLTPTRIRSLDCPACSKSLDCSEINCKSRAKYEKSYLYLNAESNCDNVLGTAVYGNVINIQYC